MSGPTVRISEKSRRVLRQLAEQAGKTMQAILDRAVEEYRRKKFLEAVNAGYAALRADAEAWAEEQSERDLWNVTLMDGLASEKAGNGTRKTRTSRKRKKR